MESKINNEDRRRVFVSHAYGLARITARLLSAALHNLALTLDSVMLH